MGRRNFTDGMEIVIEDFNAMSQAIERQMYARLGYELVSRKENAFFDDSFQVLFSSANTVLLKKGLGLQTDNTQVSPESTVRPLYLAADTSKSISAPHGSLNRIDIVCVKAALATEISQNRNYKDAATEVVSTQSMVVQKDWSADVVITAGTPNASPAVPSTPAGYIKVAELLVTAVSGLSGSGAVTDTRTKMPISSLTTVNTTGYTRVTAGATTTIAQLIADIDALLKRGWYDYFDLDVQAGADPASPSAGKNRLYIASDGTFYRKDSSGTKTPVGAGGGGGGGIRWNPVSGSAPIADEEYSDQIYLFEQSAGQKLVAYLKVPESFISGRQIQLFLDAYSPSASNQWKVQATTTLIRKNLDAVDSTTNQKVANSGDKTNTVAKQMRSLTLDLTGSDGTVNSVAVSAGDLLKVEITRIAPAGSEDTADLRLIPNSTEVKFG